MSWQLAVVIFGYGLRYPSVYLDYKGFLQIFIILYALCPTVISLVNLCIMKRYPGRKKILTRVLSRRAGSGRTGGPDRYGVPVFNPAVLFRHIPDNGLYESR